MKLIANDYEAKYVFKILRKNSPNKKIKRSYARAISSRIKHEYSWFKKI